MCGIAGIFEFDLAAPADGELLQRMTALIAHRGPDDSGHIVRGNVALGHRRLSIIDLSPAGHQPMSNEDESIWITYNGECYNYARLANRLRARGYRFRSTSDTEVLLRLYEERGERFLDDVEGMFALAIWDSRQRKLIVARDRLGIKPLFYYADSKRFLFASEMKALLADATLPTPLDIGALSEFLHLLSIPDPQCIFKSIRKLLPGHYLEVTSAGIKDKTYWDVRVKLDQSMSFETACREFDERFHSAVNSHMVADVPVGAFLSGGVDSSSIVSAATRAARLPIETFSITFRGLEEFDESPFAAQVASHCGTHHHEFNLTPAVIDTLPEIVWHADEPFAISSAFALYHLSRLARKYVKVVLSGDGSDEIFAGYVWRHQDFPPIPMIGNTAFHRRLAPIARHPAIARGLARLPQWWTHTGMKDERYLRSFVVYQNDELGELLEPNVADVVLVAWRDNTVQRYLDGAPSAEQLARKLYADTKTTMVSEMLTKVDRMTMAHGLEARVPFLDHRLVEWGFTVPGRHKLAGQTGKTLIKKAMERYLPSNILYRPKQGFNVPLNLWMRDDLREFTRDLLAPSHILRRGLFQPQAVAKLLDGHFSGLRDASNKIFALLMLELWQQRYVDRRTDFADSSLAARVFEASAANADGAP